jgi:hypothetical protein
MKWINHGRLSCARHHEGFCKTLAAQGALIHCRQVVEENRIAIRFENGYGVIVLPVPREKEVFEALVLRFLGTGTNDYQVAQYAPVPELNRGGFDEIIELCKQVALLPASKARPGSSGRATARGKNAALARRCSNFL